MSLSNNLIINTEGIKTEGKIVIKTDWDNLNNKIIELKKRIEELQKDKEFYQTVILNQIKTEEYFRNRTIEYDDD